MTDQSKIPLPEDDGTRNSLIERAAKRFDFNSYIAQSRLKDAPLPPPRRRLRKPAAKVASATPVAEVWPAAALAEGERATLAPEPRIASSLDADGDAGLDLVPAPTIVDVEPPARPTVFSGERHAIDRDQLRENGLIVPEGSVTALLEEFRIVKRQLLLQAAELRRQKAGAKAQRVLIGSPHPGEGKTYCAVNLALSIASEREVDVLLVDADFAKPSILSALGLPAGPGLMDALMHEDADVADFVIGTDIPGLWVLPAGDTTTADSEYLSSSRTEKVLDRLTQNAPNRMIIFDSPPALAASPAAELAKFVGQALVIVRADSTGQGALEDAVSLLSACPNIQLLLNGAQFSPSGRNFGSYYGYKG